MDPIDPDVRSWAVDLYERYADGARAVTPDDLDRDAPGVESPVPGELNRRLRTAPPAIGGGRS